MALPSLYGNLFLVEYSLIQRERERERERDEKEIKQA